MSRTLNVCLPPLFEAVCHKGVVLFEKDITFLELSLIVVVDTLVDEACVNFKCTSEFFCPLLKPLAAIACSNAIIELLFKAACCLISDLLTPRLRK